MTFLHTFAHEIVKVISHFGYYGVAFLMILESACIPIPSEVIMPFSGYLVSIGRLNLYLVTLCGAFGNLLGSVIVYAIGRSGSIQLLRDYGKYVFISSHHIERAEAFYDKFGIASAFIGRLLPIVRTFISLPAGIMRVSFVPFCLLTFLGSLPWCFALAYVGKILGDKWETIVPYFHRIDVPLAIVLVVLFAFWWKKNT